MSLHDDNYPPKEMYGKYVKSEYREELDPDPELTQLINNRNMPWDRDEQEKALRYNEGKPKWSLVHFKSLEPMIKVLMYGADKYAVDNWKKGLPKKEILDSMQRHMAALMDGQEVDEESKVHHIGHIMCNCMFYSYFNVIGEGKSSE